MMMPPGVVAVVQQTEQVTARQHRVRQAGMNESRAAVGSPVAIGYSPGGPELQMYVGPESPEMQPIAPQWGPGQVLGGGGYGTGPVPCGPTPYAPMGGAVEWQAQVQTIVQGGGGYGGPPVMPLSLIHI